jgi:hypothetical protein
MNQYRRLRITIRAYLSPAKRDLGEVPKARSQIRSVIRPEGQGCEATAGFRPPADILCTPYFFINLSESYYTPHSGYVKPRAGNWWIGGMVDWWIGRMGNWQDWKHETQRRFLRPLDTPSLSGHNANIRTARYRLPGHPVPNCPMPNTQ